MNSILVEPVKTMLEQACKAASALLSSASGKEENIEISEFRFDSVYTLYLKYNGDIMYKKVWEATTDQDELDIKAVLYGSMLTEMIATFCVVVKKTSEKLVDFKGDKVVKR